MIDINKKYKTKSGRNVRIYLTDGTGDYPVHGSYQDEDGEWRVDKWDAVGCFDRYSTSTLDLIEVEGAVYAPIGNPTKRELFAAMAMQGLLTDFSNHDFNNYQEVAHDAVLAADALIEALNK